MKKRYILAHDTGTGGNKAVLTDLEGNIIQSAYQSYGLEYPQPEWVEQDPELLWQAIAETSRSVIEKSAIHPAEILGVGISAQMFNLLPVDETCQPVMPMISWLDVRSVRQADPLFQGEMPAFLFKHTANIPTAKDIIPKIIWLKECRPDLWQRTRKLLDCKEYILFKLTGKIGIDWHGASVFFLFDPYCKTWSSEVCQKLGIPIEMLPATYPSTEVLGEVTPSAAIATGLLPGTPVVICAGDVACAQSGSGANAHGKAHLCIGTATWVGLSSNKLINDPHKPFWALNHIDANKWVIAGEMETGGGALMWFRDTVCQEEDKLATKAGVSTYELLGRMAASTPPGADKLLFTPWLSGERAPVLDHYVRGGFIGLSMTHTKSHMARAVMEGVAYHIRWICESLEHLGYSIQDLRSIGGGSNSPIWTQIISDVTDRRLEIVAHPLEAGAIGAALTVAVGLGIYPDMEAVDKLIQVRLVVEPQKTNQSRYNELYQQYLAIYSSLAPIYRQIYEV